MERRKSTPFFRDTYPGPEKIYNTCSVSPCQPGNERCCFVVFLVFRQIFGRYFCFRYLGHKKPHIIVGKKKTVNESTGTYRIRLQHFSVYFPETGVNIWAFYGKQGKFV